MPKCCPLPVGGCGILLQSNVLYETTWRKNSAKKKDLWNPEGEKVLVCNYVFSILPSEAVLNCMLPTSQHFLANILHNLVNYSKWPTCWKLRLCLKGFLYATTFKMRSAGVVMVCANLWTHLPEYVNHIQKYSKQKSLDIQNPWNTSWQDAFGRLWRSKHILRTCLDV